MKIKNVLKPRQKNANKGTYKKVLLIGGSLPYAGSILLCAEGALRSGVGYVTLGVFHELYPFVVGKIPEVTYLLLDDFDVSSIKDSYPSIVFGNGMSNDQNSQKILTDLLEYFEGRLVIDATGLDILKSIGLERLENTKAQVILTPHMKEFSRLFDINIENKTARSLSNELNSLASKYKAIIVLKDSQSCISDGKRIYKVKGGNAGLAHAGSGDVLAGLLGGICAYCTSSLYDIACAAHEILCSASEVLEERISLHSFKATEVAEKIGVVLKNKGL